MPANLPALKSSVILRAKIARQRLLFQCDAHRGLLLIAQDRDARMHSAASLPCVPQRSCVSFTGLLLNPRITSPGVNPALPAGLAGGASSTVTPVSPGVPAAETSSNPTIFFTFAPSHRTTAGLRVESRVTDLGLVVEGSSGVRAIAFNSGSLHAEVVHVEVCKAKLESGRVWRNIVIAGCSVDEARVGLERMFIVPAQILERLGRDWRSPIWIVEQVVIDLLRPLAHTDGPVGRTYNIAAEYVVAVVEPHMRVQRVVHQHVVLADSVKALAQLQAAIQAKIIVDAVVGAAIVKIDVPSVIAAPARVRKNVGLDHIQHGKLGIFAGRQRIEIDAFGLPPTVTPPGIE